MISSAVSRDARWYFVVQEERDGERLKRIKERIQEEEVQRAQEAQQGASADVELI